MEWLIGLGLGYVVGWFAGRSYGRRTAAKPNDPATDRQRAYLADLARDRKGGAAVLDALSIADPWADDLSALRASEAIDRLRELQSGDGA